MTLCLCLTAAVCGGLLRLWSLTAGVDAGGVPIAHISNYVMTICSAVIILGLLLVAWRRNDTHAGHEAIVCGSGGCILLMAAAALILVGSAMEFLEALFSGAGTGAAVMCLLGVGGSVCCMVFASARRAGTPSHPLFALFPVVYLIVKLILNFKSWSVDPIILDYCVILLALIFTLLAFHRTAGFVLGAGRSRSTLFFAMAAVYFCAGSMVDGLMDGSAATFVTYLGFALWQLPLICALSQPTKAE